MFVRIVLYILLIILLVLIGFLLYFNFLLNDKPYNQELIIQVSKGESTKEIIHKFNQYGFFKPNTLFYYYIGFLKLKDNSFIQAGFYKFPPYVSNYELINSLMKGKFLYYLKLTLPEGLRINEYAKIIENTFGIKQNEFLNYTQNYELLKKYKIPANTMEGYLFPSTYFLPPDISVDRLINILINEHFKNWKEEFNLQLKTLNLTKHEILTLASIIEAETPIEDERAFVSGLYHNRLRKNMLLQADPTVQYALNTREPLKSNDLKINNIYNTYIYNGLPPTPINNPSISSIIAALFPIEHNFYYMVAKGDGSGRHFFSETYSEHLKNIRKYKQNLRSLFNN